MTEGERRRGGKRRDRERESGVDWKGKSKEATKGRTYWETAQALDHIWKELWILQQSLHRASNAKATKCVHVCAQVCLSACVSYRNCYFSYLFQFMRFLYAHFCGCHFIAGCGCGSAPRCVCVCVCLFSNIFARAIILLFKQSLVFCEISF